MESYCFLRNIEDPLSDGTTPYGRRFGISFCGPVIPLGAMVEDHRTFAKNQSRLHQIGSKVLPGVFLGCALYTWEVSGKETSWLRTFGNWKSGHIRIPRQKVQCKGSANAAEK